MSDALTYDDYLKGISIRAVELLRPVPGDVVVVSVQDHLTEHQVRNLAMALRLLMPPGVRVGVLEAGMKIQIIRPDELEPAKGAE